ncbi:hypothetical protein HK097_005867, partial [Rhizophlyctis rosea]
ERALQKESDSLDNMDKAEKAYRLKIFHERANAPLEPFLDTRKPKKPQLDLPAAIRSTGQPPYVVTFDDCEPNATSESFLKVDAKNMLWVRKDLTAEQALDAIKKLQESKHWSKVPKEHQDEALNTLWEKYTEQLVNQVAEDAAPQPKTKKEKKTPVKPRVVSKTKGKSTKANLKKMLDTE